MPPAAITSALVDGKSTLFYVDNYNYVHTLTAKREEEKEASEGRATYDDDILTYPGDKNLVSTTHEMAAISYARPSGPNQGKARTRLYYSDDKGILQGLNKEGSDAWDASDIGKLGLKVQPNTSITCLLSLPSESIKVYFYKDGAGDRPHVAWWKQGDQKWKTASTGNA